MSAPIAQVFVACALEGAKTKPAAEQADLCDFAANLMASDKPDLAKALQETASKLREASTSQHLLKALLHP